MKPRYLSKFAQSSVFLGISLLPAVVLGGTIGLHFCEYWSNPQVSDGEADGFSNWTDSWLVPEGNFFGTGTNASLKGGGPVRVTWQCSNTYYAGEEGDNQQALYRSYLDDGNTGGDIGVRVSITNLARWLALNEHTSYQIRAYCSTDTNGATFQPVTVRNGSASGSALESFTPQVLGDNDYPTGAYDTNWSVRGYGDSSSTLTANSITLTIPKRNGNIRGSLSSFKITGIGTGAPVDHFESGDGMVSVVNSALGAGLTSTFRADLDTPTVTGSFSVIPTHKIKVVQPSAGFMVDTYDLLKLPAGTSVNLSDLTLATLPRGTVGQLEMVDNGGSNPVLRLNVTEMNVPSALYWTGNVAGGSWNIDTTANWSYESSPSTYLDGDEVVFDDSVAGTTNVVLNVPVLPFSVKVDNDATHPYTITGTGAINGAGTFTKLGAGPLTLSTANGYSGLTSIQAGAVTLGANNALGSAVSGTTVADGASLDLNGRDINGEAVTLSGSGPDSNGVLVNSAASPATATGSITLSGPATIGGSGEINLGTLGGSSGSLVKSGSGQVNTSTPFSFTGTFTVDEGTWAITAGYTLNSCSETIINAGGILRCVGECSPFGFVPPAANNKITLNEGGILHTPDRSCHLGTLVFDGGTLSADTARGDYANYNLDQSVSTPGNGKTSHISGGNVTLSQGGGTVFNIGTGDTLEISAKIDGDTGSSDNGLIKNGPGTLLLTNTHTYDSATTVNGGTLRVDGSANRTASVTVAAAGTLTGSGSLKAVGATTIDGTVSPGSPASPQGTLSVGTTTLNGTLAASISGAACNQLSVTGNLTLGAAAAVTISGTPTEPVYVLASCSGTLTGTFTTTSPAGYHFAYTATSASLVSNSAGYASWIASSGLAPADQGMNADPDHDGVANGLEYVLGGNPATGMDAAKLPAGQLSGGNFVFSFDRKVSSETPDIALSFQHGTDLVGWTTISVNAANPPTVTVTRSGDNLTDHVVITLPASSTTKFGRLKVTSP